ncbi:MAG: cytochrome P450 [Actinomycetota bacterium]|nr:cytochrome P450 [Acidimicrobiia bacterium]MDQ3294351.1 cytochrome P450 [Actinomycetota bacterium]
MSPSRSSSATTDRCRSPSGSRSSTCASTARTSRAGDRPDELDVGRDPNPPLAFSSGIHHCLGAALARLEAATLLPALLRELPDLRLAAKPQWRDTFVLRGLTALPVAWRQ